MGRFLIICLSLTIFEGCSSCPTEPPIGLPTRPNLISINQILYDQIPPEAQDTIKYNDLSLKEYVRKLEGRIELHDKSL